MGKLNVVVLFDRWDEPEEPGGGSSEKSPLTRTLDKKEVEDEVAETLVKLGHQATLHLLDGSIKGLHALARMECDLVFNLAESFAGNDLADYCIAAYLELLDKRFTGAGSHGLMLAQDKAVAKKILEFHGIHTPVFARSYRGRLDFSHDLEFPVIVKPAREDGSIGIEFNAVVSSIRELMERIDWLHANWYPNAAKHGLRVEAALSAKSAVANLSLRQMLNEAKTGRVSTPMFPDFLSAYDFCQEFIRKYRAGKTS